MKGWISNRVIVETQSSKDESDESEMKLLINETAEKILELVWDKLKDILTFRVKIEDLDHKETNKPRVVTERMTKRMVLRQVARIFDLLGLAAAFIVKAKIGMQRLWQSGVD